MAHTSPSPTSHRNHVNHVLRPQSTTRFNAGFKTTSKQNGSALTEVRLSAPTVRGRCLGTRHHCALERPHVLKATLMWAHQQYENIKLHGLGMGPYGQLFRCAELSGKYLSSCADNPSPKVGTSRVGYHAASRRPQLDAFITCLRF